MTSNIFLKPEGLLNNPAFSQVAVSRGARTVHVSGQVAIDEAGNVIGAGDLGEQTTQVLRNMGRALAAAGASFEDVVKITTYVVNYKPEDRAVIAKARAPFFAGRPAPASTLVGVAALAAPDWLIEIEAIAVLD